MTKKPAKAFRRARLPNTGAASRGFSLIETLLAFSIVTLLITLAGIFYQRSQNEQTAVTFVQNLGDLVTNLRERYATRPDYTGVTTNSVRTDQLAPLAMVDSLLRPVTPNGNIIQFNATDVLADGSLGGVRITIPAAGISRDLCHALIQRFQADLVRLARGTDVTVLPAARITPANYGNVRSVTCDAGTGQLEMDVL